MFKLFKKQDFISGFTLIELLVVISIISLLSSIVFASLNTARAKARDARRLSDMHQIQVALELYRNDNGVYPQTSGVRENSCFTATSTDLGVPVGGWDGTSPGTLIALVPKYIPSLPKDPKNIGIANGSQNSCYSYSGTTAGTYASCVDIVTGAYNPVDQYEYALYLNLEKTPTSGNVIHWHTIANIVHPDGPADFSTKPYNYCILGPKK